MYHRGLCLYWDSLHEGGPGFCSYPRPSVSNPNVELSLKTNRNLLCEVQRLGVKRVDFLSSSL